MQAMPRHRGQQGDDLVHRGFDAIERHDGKDQREHEQPDAVADDVVAQQRVAMIRGVSWPPAIWIATSSEPNVNTRNDSVSVMTVWYSARGTGDAECGERASRARRRGCAAAAPWRARSRWRERDDPQRRLEIARRAVDVAPDQLAVHVGFDTMPDAIDDRDDSFKPGLW